MESWIQAWRDGIAPLLPIEGLMALEKSLMENDPTLIQRTTILRTPYSESNKVEYACLIGYAGWRGKNLHTAEEVIKFFDEICLQCELKTNDEFAFCSFLDTYDEWKRTEMIKNMLPEIQAEIKKRTTI